MKIAGVILAAGESKRLGTSKQLLSFEGKSLVQHVVENISSLELDETLVITGKDNEAIGNKLAGIKHQEIYHQDFAKGMLSSIQKGIQHCKGNSFDAALIVLVDQYRIPLSHYKKLIEEVSLNSASIISTSYSGTFGAPSIFKAEMFDELLNLGSDQSAKSLIAKNKSKTKFIECQPAAFDIDVPSDLIKMEQLKNTK